MGEMLRYLGRCDSCQKCERYYKYVSVDVEV